MTDRGLGRLLVPWPERRVLCDDAELLVVDKLPGVPVHGGDERAGDDLVGRLRARGERLGEPPYLGLHQRLDKPVSGLMFLNKNPAHNRALAEEAAQRGTRRTYLAVVAATASPPRALAERGTLSHALQPIKGQATRVVRRAGLQAITHFEVLRRARDLVLLRLQLETGRKHQIRAQLAHIGFPVVGDALYGGRPATRLLLHCCELQIRCLGRQFSSPAPGYFEAMLNGDAEQPGQDLAGLLEDAGCLRWRLSGHADAFRLINGAADLMPGVTVDVYGGYATLAVSGERAFGSREELGRALLAAGAEGVYLKTRVRADLRHRAHGELAPDLPLAGRPVPGELEVREGALKLSVELTAGLSTGLFVDQRDNRALVSSRSAGLRVLNLFAYTCSFSVAAALGGAREVVSVDLSRRALNWGRRNFELNGLDLEPHRFVVDDALKWLARAARRGERFDLVVVDPPSFSTRHKATFSVGAGYTKLLASVLSVVAKPGSVLAVTNHRKTSPVRLRGVLREAAERAGREIVSLRAGKSGIDCPDGPDGPEPSKSVWLEVR